jgi:large subunit ribosomal protein L13
MIINAENSIVGRMSTVVVKKALKGEKIDIINCEKAVITGSKENVFNKYKIKGSRGGPFKGPFLPKMPDRFVRRIIRGMLPYKQSKGKEAFKRIICYISIPNEFKDKKIEKIKEADISRIKNLKYTTIGEVCKFLKNKQW